LAAASAEAVAPASKSIDVVFGDAKVVWLETFASEGDDWINDIVRLKGGTYVAAGFLNRVDGETPSDWRALAVKFRDDGEVFWSREYGAGGEIDAFWTAREKADGGLMFGGFSSRIGPGGINAYFATTASDGTLLKENAYGTPGYDRITSLAPTPNGFIGVGHAEGEDGRDLFYVGVDEMGAEMWRKAIAGKGSNGALYVEPAGDGNYIVVGGTDEEGDADILVVKIDAEGNEFWRRTIGARGTDDINHGLVVLPDGRIVIPGYTQSWGAGERDFMAAVMTKEGEIRSIETYGGAADDHVILAKPDSNGRVWMIGYTKSGEDDEWEIMLTRLDAKGSFNNAVVLIGGELDDNGAAVLPLADGGALIGGYSNNLGQGAQDGFVARLSAPKWRAHPDFKRLKVK
jgi:hypothetical protein